MKDIRIDDQGQLHCWKCNSTQFTSKRTMRSKVALGVGALLTHKKLKCLVCGEYNQTGNAVSTDPAKRPETRLERLEAWNERAKERTGRMKAQAAEMKAERQARPSFRDQLADQKAERQAKAAARPSFKEQVEIQKAKRAAR